MKSPVAQKFGSFGKSFVSPATAAAVLGAALIASDTTDTAETAWSPAAACLLPDVLPVAGTLLSYGGNRQLAAGGTVTHGGAFTATGQITGSSLRVPSGGMELFSGSTRLLSLLTGFATLGSGRLDIYNGGIGQIRLGGTGTSHAGIYNSGTTVRFRTASDSADAPITCGAITASNFVIGGTAGYGTNAVRIGPSSVGGIKRDLIIGTGESQTSGGMGEIHFEANGFQSWRMNLSGALIGDGRLLSCGNITASGNIQVGTTGPILVGNIGGTGRFQVTRNDGTADFYVGEEGTGGTSMRWFGLSSGAPGPAATDIQMRRNATGPAWVSQSNGGLQIRNLANNSDAALTCGAITASGTIVTRNGTSPTSIQITNTYTSPTSFGVLDIRANASQTAYEIGSWLGSAGGANLPINFGHRNSAGSFTTAISIASTGAVTAGSAGLYAAGNYMGFTNRVTLMCTTDGVLRLSNWAETGFNLLQFGGSTSSAPALKRVGATLAVRLADDSGDGSITCGTITASGSVQETPTQSALNPTASNIPSGKRQGWYNTALGEFRDWVNIGGTLLKSAAYT